MKSPRQQAGVPEPVQRDSRAIGILDQCVVAWELLRAGFGVSMQPEVLGEEEPGVEKVLPDFPSLEFPIWLVTHRELQTSRRIRIVFDLLARGLTDAARHRDRDA